MNKSLKKFLDVLQGKPPETDESYKEIFKLERLLKKADIPFEIDRLYDGWQISYPEYPIKGVICSAIQHYGSRGSQDDLIEIYGLTANGESVEGYLTAEEVFNRIRIHYKTL